MNNDEIKRKHREICEKIEDCPTNHSQFNEHINQMFNQARSDERTLLIKTFTEKIKNLDRAIIRDEVKYEAEIVDAEFTQEEQLINKAIEKTLSTILSQLSQEDTK